jgi:hypothetical protein
MKDKKLENILGIIDKAINRIIDLEGGICDEYTKIMYWNTSEKMNNESYRKIHKKKKKLLKEKAKILNLVKELI